MRCLCFSLLSQKRSAVFLSVARADSRAMTPRAALLVVACALTAGSAGGARPNPNEARLSLASLRPEPSQKSHARAGLADWMAEDAASLYARTLHEVTLPGTHDSGAYWLTKQTIPDARFPPGWAAAAIAAAERLGVPVDEVITAWALTQSADVARSCAPGSGTWTSARGGTARPGACTTPRWACQCGSSWRTSRRS